MSTSPTPFDVRLQRALPELEALLNADRDSEARYSAAEVTVSTELVTMRDGARLATEVYMPPVRPAPVLLTRTPYGRKTFEEGWIAYARRGWVLVAQDCRATGDSEPDSWDYMVFEEEDSLDCVTWIGGQSFFDGFLGALGGSYVGDVQFCVGAHDLTASIAPEVAGMGMAPERWPRLHMFINSYTRSMGNGADRPDVSHVDLEREILDETLATGYYNEPLYRPFSAPLRERYPEITQLPPHDAQAWLRRTLAPTDARDARSFCSWRSTPTVSRSATPSDLPMCSGRRSGATACRSRVRTRWLSSRPLRCSSPAGTTGS